ncbi:glycosyltransferase [Streptosporangium saharense]|uniref:glycosyltransferase n=1 Tax=Streptosporangium saharense TaxID=1706840 RepID=UPI0036A9D65C
MLTIHRTEREFDHLGEFFDLIGPERTRRLHDAAAEIARRLDGGTLWHVNSTAAGGGVAEMLHILLPLYRSLGVRAGWLVVGGDGRFFEVTKRLGTALYGSPGDGGPLGPAEQTAYLDVLSANAGETRELLGRRDILLLHDHQTAGLVEILGGEVSAVYWRCHVGVDEEGPASDAAWDFLAPFLSGARGLVFSVPWHVPRRLGDHRVEVVPPFVSPFSAKNRVLNEGDVRTCLAHCGLSAPTAGPPARGPLRALRHPVRLVAEGTPNPGEPSLVQVSRWDRLKDMDGVLAAFAAHVEKGYLTLAGPDPLGIQDDVEQGVWFDRCLAAWRELPPATRRRVGLLCLPMADLEENALLVNALQRSADVVVQKSLAEGFGLTVTEAMWKSRVVVASAVGGIREQITHGENGLLVADPADLSGFGTLLARVAAGEVDTGGMGARARLKVLRDFLPDREVIGTARLLDDR